MRVFVTFSEPRFTLEINDHERGIITRALEEYLHMYPDTVGPMLRELSVNPFDFLPKTELK